MIEFYGRLTKSGAAYKISVPDELVNSKRIPLHTALTARVMQPEKPFAVIVPTLQGKVLRFQQHYGLVVDKSFLTGILKQRATYKVLIVE